MNVNPKRFSFVSAVLAACMSTQGLFLLFLTFLGSVLVYTKVLAKKERPRTERFDNPQLVNASKAGADRNILVLLIVSYAKSQGATFGKTLYGGIKVAN